MYVCQLKRLSIAGQKSEIIRETKGDKRRWKCILQEQRRFANKNKQSKAREQEQTEIEAQTKIIERLECIDK